METTNPGYTQLLEKMNKEVDDLAAKIADVVYVKMHELIVEAAQEIAIAENITNSGIVHAAMRDAHGYALRYAQIEELLERSSCDVAAAAQAAQV